MRPGRQLKHDPLHPFPSAVGQSEEMDARTGTGLRKGDAVQGAGYRSDHAAMEIERIREAVGPSVPVAGGYTYAEQAPFDAGLSTDQLAMQPIATQTGSVLVAAIGV